MEHAGINQSTVMDHFQELARMDKYSADITAGYAEQISTVDQALNTESVMKPEKTRDLQYFWEHRNIAMKHAPASPSHAMENVFLA